MPADAVRSLPRILIATDGRHAVNVRPGLDAGLLLRDSDLATLIRCADSGHPPMAVDIDSIGGLGGDDDGVDFVTSRLRVPIILTRRPALAARVAEHGRLGLVHLFGYDSTGLARALEGHPRIDRVGSVLSPGLVVTHLRPDELAVLPRPLLAYGLIDEVEDAEACLALVDAIVVRPVLAGRLASGSPA
ncbi:MAG: glycerol-3-phosphate responsive antiterminator [Candidatus Limnocylindrales bacterium]